MQEEHRKIGISRVLDAPRSLVYQAFTDPDHFVAWWGPIGNSLPRDEVEFDVRPGGHQRWTEVSASDPDIRVQVRVDLTEVVDGEVLDGLMRVAGHLPGGFEPFDTRVRVEFFDEEVGRTRLEIRQWLPGHLAGPSEEGWRQGFAKLDAALAIIRGGATDNRERE